jgi:tryptophan aminotransferase
VPEDILAPELGFTEIETDAEGLSSLSLHKILESWPSTKPKPKVLYTIPVRGNKSTNDLISIRE